MTLEEQQEMALLKATLKAVRRLNELAQTDEQCVSIDDAMTGRLAQEWARIKHDINTFAP